MIRDGKKGKISLFKQRLQSGMAYSYDNRIKIVMVGLYLFPQRTIDRFVDAVIMVVIILASPENCQNTKEYQIFFHSIVH